MWRITAHPEGFATMGQRHETGPCRIDRWWRSARLTGIAVGLLLVEWTLVGEVGSPMALTRTLHDLGDPWAGPVVSVLALMALLAEAMVGYLLLVLALRSLGALPERAGRIARRVTFAVTPVMVRRLVDLLVGGTLLVQMTLAGPGAPPGPRSSCFFGAVVASSAISRSDGPATGDLVLLRLEAARRPWPADKHAQVEARPTLRRSAVPLPPWLGGGSSKPAPRHRAGSGEHTVGAGDTLWDIAAAHLEPAERSAAAIDRYWQQVYRTNRSVVGADPDLIHPGMRLSVVPFRQDRR
jgi:resuscitation-promoting factor RpfA